MLKRLFLLCLVGLGLVSSGWGQREDTVFDILLTESQMAAPFQTNPVRNIGQSSHLFVILLEDVTAGSCISPQNVDMGMEYSYGNGVWVRGGTDVTRVSANADGIITANQNVAGAFPLVRFAVRNYDNVACQLTISYSGAVAAFNVNNVSTNNTFLGIAAISTLANPSNLNIQYTPSVPTIQSVDITNFSTFYQSLYDIWSLSPWIRDNTVGASWLRAGTNTCTCASGCQTGSSFRFTDEPDAITWVSGASGSGYSAGSWQCNVNRTDLAAAITLYDPYVDASFDGANFTITPKVGSGYDAGFRGNSLDFYCGNNPALQLGLFNFASGCSNNVTLNYAARLGGGRTQFRTQTTPQGLQGCVELRDEASNFSGTFFTIYSLGANCATVGAEYINGRTDRGVQTELYIDDYQAFSYTPSNGSLSGNSGTVWGVGVPFIPAFVGGVTEFQWAFSDNKQNTTNFATNWRNLVQPVNGIVSGSYGGMVIVNGVTYSQQGIKLYIGNPNPTEWVNSSGVPLMDAIMNFNEGGPVGTNKLIGQLWNAVYYQVNVPADTVFVFDSFDWHSWTNSSANGSLLLRWD